MSIQVSNKKLHKNPSSGSRVDACGQTDGQILRKKQKLFASNLT